MKTKKRFWTKRISSFELVLVGFVLVLILLFVYQQKINRDVQHYTDSIYELDRLYELSHDIDHYFVQTYRFIDYDRILDTQSNFEKSIAKLRMDTVSVSQYNYLGDQNLQKIERLYLQKIALMEDFKTYNTRITNGIYLLHDLRMDIHEYYKNNIDKEMHIFYSADKIFFMLGQMFIGSEIDQDAIIEDIKKIEGYTGEYKSVSNFVISSKQLLQDNTALANILRQNKNLHLSAAIANAGSELKRYYKKDYRNGSTVSNFFFLSGVLMLLSLYMMYRRMRKTNIDLSSFRYAIENSDNVIVLTDADRNIIYTNDAFEYHSGYKKDEVMGKNPNILSSGVHTDEFYRDMNKVLDAGKEWKGVLINKRKNGSLFYEKSSIIPIFVDNELSQYLAIKLDITDYIEQQQKLQQSAIIYETIEDGILILDRYKKVISANSSFSQIFGYSQEEIIGFEPRINDSFEGDRLLSSRIWSALAIKERWAGRITNKNKNGKMIPIWLTIVVVKDFSDIVKNYIAIYTNLEEIIEMEEKADFLAYHDSLTHLPNRAYFEKSIEYIFEFARNNQQKVSVFFIDLDRFKVINDTLGHNIGDEILKQLAVRIKKVLAKDDLLIRFGGDEFIAICYPMQDRQKAANYAQNILTVIKEPIAVLDYSLNTTASIGIAIYPDDGRDQDTIVKHADIAMYHAKEKGKDNYKYYTKQLSVDVQSRLYLEQELKNATLKEELSVYYQPQYDFKSGKIVGAEALLRWSNPLLGNVDTEQFIQIAEETGMIVNIGYFVMEKAFEEFSKWESMGLGVGRIAVNISSVQFRQKDLMKNFKNIIEKIGISPKNIEIEITERYIMEYSISNINILDELRRMGCKISVDDFGTGYSSLGYMKTLAINAIKIDKSFISDIPNDIHNVEVSKAIIALAESLNYDVIAEGVENQQQVDFLIENGCRYGQGYMYSPPLGSDAFIAFAKSKLKKP